jgi:hypothetical protein
MDILKMSFFEKRARDLKFLYIITSSASALPFSRGYLYALGVFYYLIRTESIMLRIHKIAEILQKMGRNLGNLFFKNRDGGFSGMF